MSKHLDTIRTQAEKLFKEEEFVQIIELLKDDVLEKYKDAALYAWRSRAHFRLTDDPDITMKYAQKAIEADSDYYLGFLSRGNAWKAKGENEKAIADYTKAIKLKPDYSSAYYNRGNSWYDKGAYEKAKADYNKAIELKPEDAEPYYNRALLHRDIGKNLDKSINDFKKYIELTASKNDIWTTYATEFIQELKEKVKDNELKEIHKIVNEIKKVLLVDEGCVTHYTGLSTTKILVLNTESKFRLSEGAFLNDTSEGTELLGF